MMFSTIWFAFRQIISQCINSAFNFSLSTKMNLVQHDCTAYNTCKALKMLHKILYKPRSTLDCGGRDDGPCCHACACCCGCGCGCDCACGREPDAWAEAAGAPQTDGAAEK